MHEEIAYNSRIREEYELSLNNGSSAKTTPCPNSYWICENGTCYPAPTVVDKAPSLNIVPSNTAKGFSFKEPSVKLPETVDTNYSGKSVLTCLLELHRDLLIAIVKDLKADGKWFKLLFQSAADLRSALTAIVWAINTDVVRRKVIYVVHSIDGGNFPEEPKPEYALYFEEQFVQPIIR